MEKKWKITNLDENVGKLETYIASRDINWCNQCGKQLNSFTKC